MSSLQIQHAMVDASSIGCVFVIYHPRGDVVSKITSFSEFGYSVVVVSNGCDLTVLENIDAIAHVKVIKNVANVGLATALNQGIQFAAKSVGVAFVCLFDQDSAPDVRMPLELAQELQARPFPDAACIGPKLKDIKSDKASYDSHNKHAGERGLFSIPTSGTLIPIAVIEKVGFMKDALFIDGIDHEWCARAAKSGLKILVSKSITMRHDMGDLALNWFGQYKPLYKNPLRHFYIVRNSVYLALYGDMPIGWRMLELVKTFRRIPAYLWASGQREASFKLILKGLFDGMSGKLGPLN